jgi:hypothetical protein
MALKQCPSCGQNNPGDATQCLHCEHPFAPETIEKPKASFPVIPLFIVAGVLSLIVMFVQQQLSPPEPKVLNRVCIDPATQPEKVQQLAREGYVQDGSGQDPATARLTCYVKYDRLPEGVARPAKPAEAAKPEEDGTSF